RGARVVGVPRGGADLRAGGELVVLARAEVVTCRQETVSQIAARRPEAVEVCAVQAERLGEQDGPTALDRHHRRLQVAGPRQRVGRLGGEAAPVAQPCFLVTAPELDPDEPLVRFLAETV